MSEALTLAVQNAPVLRALGAGGPLGMAQPVSDWAAAIGRDPSNLSKTLTKLEEAGLAATRYRGKVRLAEITPAGAALLPGLAALDGSGDPVTLTHAQLQPSPLNPRKDWTSDAAIEALDGLRASIVVNGLLQPIVVQRAADANGVRAIIAGESRWRAIGLAIEDDDLAADFPIAVVFRDLDAAEHAKLALIENLVRRDLHPLEEAEAFAALEAADVKRAEVGEIAGRTPEFIGQRVRLLQLPEETRTRMRLPTTDPQHLTVTGARLLLQGKPEDAPMRSATRDAAQADLEDLAPRQLELTPSEALVLFEVEAATRVRPAKSELGSAAKMETWLNLERNPREAKLVREGLLTFSPQHPYKVALLPAGTAWLGRRPGAFMPDSARLQTAREEAGLSAERIAELEAAEDFETAWLNPYRRAPEPAPNPRAVLIKLEIEEAKAAQGDYQPAKYRPELAPADLADHAHVTGPDSSDGVPRVRPGHAATYAQMAEHYAGWGEKKGRRAIIERLRDELGITGEDKGFAPGWLKGPFTPDEAWKVRNEERMAEARRAQESKTALEAARERVHMDLDTFERGEAAALPSPVRGARLAEIARAADLQGPWRPYAGGWHSGVQIGAASAGDVALLMQPEGINLRLAIIGFNLATGVDPADWLPTREDVRCEDDEAEDETVTADLERDAYIAKAATHLRLHHPDLGLDREEAVRRMTAHLDGWLAQDGVSFGDAACSWAAEDARADADLYAEELETAGERLEPA